MRETLAHAIDRLVQENRVGVVGSAGDCGGYGPGQRYRGAAENGEAQTAEPAQLRCARRFAPQRAEQHDHARVEQHDGTLGENAEPETDAEEQNAAPPSLPVKIHGAVQRDENPRRQHDIEHDRA